MLWRRLILMIALMVFHSEFNLALANPGVSGTDRCARKRSAAPRLVGRQTSILLRALGISATLVSSRVPNFLSLPAVTSRYSFSTWAEGGLPKKNITLLMQGRAWGVLRARRERLQADPQPVFPLFQDLA